MSTAGKSVGTALVLLFILGLTYFLFWYGSADGMEAEVRLPILAIAGIVSLLVALTLASLAFAAVGLADKNQALALPDGSIRAVIALSLIVLFAICAVYLYGSLAGGCELKELRLSTIEEVTALQGQAARADSQIEVFSVFPPVASQPPAEPPKGPFTVRYRSRMSSQAADFAKQLLILIGTLVTSVSSFYFGSRAAESARGSVSGMSSPMITAVSPSKLEGGKNNQEVTIAGTGFDGSAQVKLVQGDNTLLGKNVHAVGSSIVCTFDIDDKRTGAWSLVVVIGDSQSPRYPVQIE
jgi:hypothetical protein